MRVLITGAAGGLGSEVATCLVCERGVAPDNILAVDDLSRLRKFGLRENADPREVKPGLHRLHELGVNLAELSFTAPMVLDQIRDGGVSAIVHCAAQTSHPRSLDDPRTDFDTNVAGTMAILEAVRQCHEARRPSFVYVSSSKVYGQNVEKIGGGHGLRVDCGLRYTYRELPCAGVDESCPIGDQTALTPFGVSKVWADLMTQEYARAYGIRAAVIRPNCHTGPTFLGVELQGWGPHLVRKVLRGEPITIFGYEGLQVRDYVHGADVARAVVSAIHAASSPAIVLNVGGNDATGHGLSVMQALALIHELAGVPASNQITHAPSRYGDWPIYLTDARRAGALIGWKPLVSLRHLFTQLVEVEKARIVAEHNANE